MTFPLTRLRSIDAIMLMSRQEQFLMIVQCGILAHVKDMRNPKATDDAIDLMGSATEAVQGLPENRSVRDSAREFINSFQRG